jgi:DNA-binding response OmpR family regulator
VLVVEDHAEVRAHLREQLAPHYRVLEAGDGAQGLAVAREERPDLVLADVMMPGTDGIALLDALKADEQLRAIPVMLLTARAAEDDRVDGIQRGADDYLVKPFSTQELLARVERLMQTRRSLQARYRKELKVAPADVVVDSDHEIFLRQVLEAAEAHLAEPSFGAEALAEAIGMSRRQLTRKLKALLGEPPSDLLRRLRLERAAQLLEAEHGRVSEVAYAVGFKSASHFTRIFRAHFGCTPSAYSDQLMS